MKDKFYETYQGKVLEDAGAYMSKDATRFFRAMRSALKKRFEELGINLVEFSIGHYDMSSFVEKNGKYVYISYSVQRGGMPINLDGIGLYEKFLYRTAKGVNDYIGGRNNYCSWEEIVDRVNYLFQ
ncbi:MAG: hypothetical protein Q4E34_00320 [Synergistaceae bacterium]|nr:hypothetical protein [Synergistaceae bacterium]